MNAPQVKVAMRDARLVVTRRCNQACTFCTSVDNRTTDASLASLSAEVELLAAAGVRTLTLTGGEPLLHADLVALVRHARAAGMSAVLETNATRLTPALAQTLKDAGLSSIRISVVTTDAAAHAKRVASTTTPRHVFRGIAAAVEAGLEVRIRLPIAKGLASAAARLSGLHRAFPAIARYELAPTEPGAASPEADDANNQMSDAWREARAAGVELVVASDHPLVPCVHRLSGGANRLFAASLSERDQGRTNDACDACRSCALSRHCGIDRARLERAAGHVTPVAIADATPFLRPGKSAGSRLHVLGARDVERFFHVDYEYEHGSSGLEATSRVGIVYRCNQVCTFCNLADMKVDLDAAKVRAAIAASRARGSTRVILTGGEPTLSRDLEAHIAYARDIGFTRVELQTNAVLLDRAGAAAKLRAAGLTHAQVSLHGPDAEASDRLTAAPGTHKRTIVGVDRLLEQGVQVLLNYLLFRDVCQRTLDFVEMAGARWGQVGEQLTIQFHSPRNEFTSRAEALRHLAPYREYADVLRRAIDRGRALGFRVHDLQDPTGIPSLCVLDHDASYLGPILEQATRPRIHQWESRWMTRVPACATCDLRTACLGVPAHYLELFGDEEFHAVHLDKSTTGGAAIAETPPP